MFFGQNTGIPDPLASELQSNLDNFEGGPHGERRRIDDIRRDVFSVSKTVTSLVVGMLEGDGALSLDDPVLTHLPELGDTAAGPTAVIVWFPVITSPA